VNNRKPETGAIGELFGALADSFTHNRTDRLLLLEDRLALLRRWAVIGIAIAFAYLGYQLWGELRSELDTHQIGAEQVRALDADEASDEASSSIFLIFAVALGGPIALIVGYLVFGFIYNVLHDALIRHIPLARFFVVPVLLLMGLLLLESRRDVVKEMLFAVYDEVEYRIASASTLREQARVMGERMKELRQMEAQLRALNDESQTYSETPRSLQEAARTGATESVPADTVTQDEAVRRLGEMMLQLQGMSLQQPGEANGQPAADIQPNQTADTLPVPAPDSNATPSRAVPADI
jgi:hypothetical protein